MWKDGNEPVIVGDTIIKNVKPIYIYSIVEPPNKNNNQNYIEMVNIDNVTVLKSIYEK